MITRQPPESQQTFSFAVFFQPALTTVLIATVLAFVWVLLAAKPVK